jgi:uncharacterized protein (DUF2236 family)
MSTAHSDDGYFPRGRSVLRMVHEERAVGLLYGQRALGIGAISPLNFVGTLRHTRSLERPFQRPVHTAKAFETIFFGSRADLAQVFYELFVRPLTDPEREELWQDYVRFGELFGMPAQAGPQRSEYSVSHRRLLASTPVSNERRVQPAQPA